MQLYSAGVLVPAAQLFVFVSHAYWYPDPTSAYSCYDGDLTNYCSTLCDPRTAFMIITSRVPVDQVLVYNRRDCCESRIVGATISLSWGGNKLWHNTFAKQQGNYTFSSEY